MIATVSVGWALLLILVIFVLGFAGGYPEGLRAGHRVGAAQLDEAFRRGVEEAEIERIEFDSWLAEWHRRTAVLDGRFVDAEENGWLDPWEEI